MSWNNLGSLLDRLGRRREAIQCVARAHELDPANGEAAYNLGALLLASGRPERALPLLEETRRRHPDLVQASLLRARALETLGRGSEALTAWREVAEREPQAWLQVARLELAAGRTSAARAALQKGVEKGGAGARSRALKDPKLAPLLGPG
jgi:tetratricopeptide (TPR) repeat protein